MQSSIPYSQCLAECQTEDISPHKLHTPSTHKNIINPISQFTTQPNTTYQSKKQSRTEQQIYSHELINTIMNKRQNNTVNHKIGEFDSQMQLYAKPRNLQDSGMMQFSDQRQMYQSDYTKRINQINKKLNQGNSLSQRIKSRKHQSTLSFYQTNNKPTKNKRPVSAAQAKISQPTHKKISVSGLVSYNFNSVNARKNLGFDFQRDDEKLAKILTKLETRNACYVNRQHSIVSKKKQQKAKQQQEIKKAIFCDFQTGTENFLSNLRQEIDQQQTVYGMKWNKLLCIKQLMEKEGVNYDEAEEIVNEIEEKRIQAKKKDPQVRLQRDDERELNNRKQAVQKGRVMVKQLYFVD